ncbi:MAG: hypothetical protein ACYCU7_00415 [Acidimicrobiales bacterium]
MVGDPPGGGGLGRSIWSPGHDVAPCDLPTVTCLPVAVPVGDESQLAEPAAAGTRLLAVGDDALWPTSLGSTGPPVQVAGPLYSNAAPSGYYGEVDWTGTFAWSAAVGPRGGSAELVDEGYCPPVFETP